MSAAMEAFQRELLGKDCARCGQPLRVDEFFGQIEKAQQICNPCFNGDNGEAAA